MTCKIMLQSKDSLSENQPTLYKDTISQNKILFPSNNMIKTSKDNEPLETASN